MGEIWAILTSSQIIQEKGWIMLLFVLDCKQVEECIVQDTNVKHENFLIVKTCRELISLMQSTKLEYIEM